MNSPGSLLQSARKLANLSRTELARKLGRSYQFVYDVENDRRAASLEKVYEIARAIGCDPHEIDGKLASEDDRDDEWLDEEAVRGLPGDPTDYPKD